MSKISYVIKNKPKVSEFFFTVTKNNQKFLTLLQRKKKTTNTIKKNTLKPSQSKIKKENKRTMIDYKDICQINREIRRTEENWEKNKVKMFYLNVKGKIVKPTQLV